IQLEQCRNRIPFTGLKVDRGKAPKRTTAMTSSSLIEGMNPEQSQVVAHNNGPLLVAAGAGCGKTRVLVHRVARFVEDGADPARVLAVTFSTKTAREMND